MPKPHSPITPVAFSDLIGWLTARQHGLNPVPVALTQDLPCGVLAGVPEFHKDPEDGSIIIGLTMQPVMPERLHVDDREGDNSAARSRLRYLEPEAVLVIRLALANGGTMYINENYNSENEGDGSHYPDIYSKGISLFRVLGNAKPGEQVRQIVDRTSALRHRDCRSRTLYKTSGPSRSVRGVDHFLKVAAETFAKPNKRDGLTGPERFGISTEAYVGFLKQALALHHATYPTSDREQAA